SPGRAASPRHLREDPGTDTPVVWILRCWICCHARARSPAHHRTGTGETLACVANVEAECCPADARAGRRFFLAAPILRLQRLERSQADREAALYSSQSGEKRHGSEPGAVGVEQLPALSLGSRGSGGD